jgi:hypothetical protein
MKINLCGEFIDTSEIQFNPFKKRRKFNRLKSYGYGAIVTGIESSKLFQREFFDIDFNASPKGWSVSIPTHYIETFQENDIFEICMNIHVSGSYKLQSKTFYVVTSKTQFEMELIKFSTPLQCQKFILYKLRTLNPLYVLPMSNN